MLLSTDNFGNGTSVQVVFCNGHTPYAMVYRLVCYSIPFYIYHLVRHAAAFFFLPRSRRLGDVKFLVVFPVGNKNILTLAVSSTIFTNKTFNFF